MEVPETQRFLTNHYGTTEINAKASTVLLRIMPMHHDSINQNRSSAECENPECVTGALNHIRN